MNASWLLKSSTLVGAMAISAGLSMLVLLVSPDGLPALNKRQAEIRACKADLLQKARYNRTLAEEVRRLASRDPELLEALARRQGYAKPGETVYTFRDPSDRH